MFVKIISGYRFLSPWYENLIGTIVECYNQPDSDGDLRLKNTAANIKILSSINLGRNTEICFIGYDDIEIVDQITVFPAIKKMIKWIDYSTENFDHKFFSNHSCKFYPCHDMEEINCLFCFCPLYYLMNCGGNYIILENGKKDCSKCLLPHTKDNYDYIIKKLKS